jgi:hypothetical protein
LQEQQAVDGASGSLLWKHILVRPAMKTIATPVDAAKTLGSLSN